MTAKGKRKLLTGETVTDYEEQFPLKAICTHCPDKWAFVDLESGNIYSWDVKKKGWKSPPKKALKALRKALGLEEQP